VRRDDRGNAVIEFVFVALVVMVPLVYLIAAIGTVQRSQLAVSAAARDAGRAFATSNGVSDTSVRVDAAVRLALTAQGLPDDATVRFVAAGDDCTSTVVAPVLAAGAVFTVCVTRHTSVPAVPHVLAGRGITSVGKFVVHVDDFRTVTP
jgi:Flp pilus assembly protein TadG